MMSTFPGLLIDLLPQYWTPSGSGIPIGPTSIAALCVPPPKVAVTAIAVDAATAAIPMAIPSCAAWDAPAIAFKAPEAPPAAPPDAADAPDAADPAALCAA
jgi:hypothetical protein